ncbi:hypothetical protein BHE74_00003132 [Ensete ventricosum]|nr:hypothetical protein BHE74_00003132 [Ensete ventricosum]
MGGVSPNPSNRACPPARPLLLRHSGLCLASSAMTAQFPSRPLLHCCRRLLPSVSRCVSTTPTATLLPHFLFLVKPRCLFFPLLQSPLPQPSPPPSLASAAGHHLPFSSSAAFLPCLPTTIATDQPSGALLYRSPRRTPLPRRYLAASLPSLSRQPPAPAILNRWLLSSSSRTHR